MMNLYVSIIKLGSVLTRSSRFTVRVLEPGIIFIPSHCRGRLFSENKSGDTNHTLIRVDYFDQVENRTKDTYLEMVGIYKEKERLRRGHIEFIYSALKHMKDFGVEKDLEVYKSLVDVFPKGKMIARNIFQVEFMHYPKHQQCAIDLLEQMEENGVIPDWDMEDQLTNVFGSKGYPLRRYWRMMYWMPKWRNASPFPLPRPLPSDSLALAKLAIQRITEVDINTEISVYKTSSVKESVDDTWIVSGQSEEQRQLLYSLADSATLFVEGPFRIWLRNLPLSYFLLRADPVSSIQRAEVNDCVKPKGGIWSKPEKGAIAEKTSVHQQEDGILLAVCATGTSSRDSLLSWLRSLQPTNPCLAKIPVLFRLSGSSPDLQDVAALEEEKVSLPEQSKSQHS